MWIVAKYKTKELETLKKVFFQTLGDMPEFYNPKIKYEGYVNNRLKTFKKNILDNYLICKHSKFNNSGILSLLKNSRGLIYFLDKCQFHQKELEDFVKFCKSHEDPNGYLTQDFFQANNKTKVKFISGPFSQMIFDII